MVKILIADDHAIMREVIKQVLAETDDLLVAGEATNGVEVLEHARNEEWDLVLLDLAMPEKNGLETLKELRLEKPDLPVLVLSIYPEEQYGVRLLKTGAAGYLTKESAPEKLIAAIREIAQTGKYVSPSLAEKLAFSVEASIEKGIHETLSDQERKVMLMITCGKTVKEIADELELSIKTISTYRISALQKMRMKNDAEFICYAVKQGLVDLFDSSPN